MPPAAPKQEACAREWLIDPVSLHQRELAFPSPKLPIANSFLARGGTLCLLPLFHVEIFFWLECLYFTGWGSVHGFLCFLPGGIWKTIWSHQTPLTLTGWKCLPPMTPAVPLALLPQLWGRSKRRTPRLGLSTPSLSLCSNLLFFLWGGMPSSKIWGSPFWKQSARIFSCA